MKEAERRLMLYTGKANTGKALEHFFGSVAALEGDK
jgi:hypothetical protein